MCETRSGARRPVACGQCRHPISSTREAPGQNWLHPAATGAGTGAELEKKGCHAPLKRLRALQRTERQHLLPNSDITEGCYLQNLTPVVMICSRGQDSRTTCCTRRTRNVAQRPSHGLARTWSAAVCTHLFSVFTLIALVEGCTELPASCYVASTDTYQQPEGVECQHDFYRKQQPAGSRLMAPYVPVACLVGVCNT
jgi:hypothetical protein